MDLLKDRMMHWWEIGLIKWAVLFIGIAIGANWPEIFQPYTVALVIVGAVVGVIAGYLWVKK